MNSKLCQIFILVSLLLFLSPEISAQENFNITSINQYYHNWTDGVNDVAVQGDYAYLACLEDGLRIVNISNLDSPFDVSHLALPLASAIDVSGNYAFVGSSSSSDVFVVDISNPANPFTAATISGFGSVNVLKIEGNRLYGSGGNMMIADISDPFEAVPFELAVGHLVGFDVHGSTLYAASETDGMTVYDISDLEYPVPMGNFRDPNGYWLNDVAVKDGYAYLANGGSGLIVVDLATMQQVAAIDSLIYAFGVEIKGNLLYMNYGDPECPLAIIDITNPLSPQTLGIYDPPEDIRNFEIAGDLVYVADSYHGVRVVDVSDPAMPVETAYYNRYGFNLDVQVVGSLAYVRETVNLTMMDMSDPQNPIELSQYEPRFQVNSLEIAGNTAFLVGHGYEFLEAVDIADPAHPELIGTFSADYDIHYQIAIYDHYAYIVENDGIRIIDIADPSEMIEVGYYSRSFGNGKIASDRQYLYIKDHLNIGSIVVLDLTNPTEPELVGTRLMDEHCYDMLAKNGMLFVSTGYWVSIFNGTDTISEPLAVIDGFDQYEASVDDIQIIGNRMILSLRNYGIVVYDIHDLTNPQFVGRYDTPGSALNADVSGDILYLADGSNLGIYDISLAVLDAPQRPEAKVAEFALLSNYPNPFNSSTQIRFEVGTMTHVNIGVYDVLGRNVATLADRDFVSGTHAIPWNGADAGGRMVASGRYFVMARAGDAVRSLPIVLLK
jgi:hypothetical protein